MAKSVSPLQVGKPVLVDATTRFYTGRVVELTDAEIVLEESAWIASTGRLADALARGTLDEVEPVPSTGAGEANGVTSVSRGAVIAVQLWTHPLPREQR